MKIKTSLQIQAAMLAASIAFSAYYVSRLPDRVPTHWNIHNQVDQYGSKWTAILMGPLMILFGMLLTVALPKLSPKKYEIEKFEATYSYSMVLVSGLFLFISVLILKATAGGIKDIGGIMMTGMFLFFAFLGNVLGKVRRNFYMGIRTPWTLASEATWDATHRLAGKLYFYGGIAGAILAAVGMPVVGSIVLLLVMSLWPVVQSYFFYKKLG